MTRMNLNTPSSTTIAVAADYADAMMTARKAKNVLFLFLLLVLLIQVSLFFLLRFNVLRLDDQVAIGHTPAASVAASTQPGEAGATQPVEPSAAPTTMTVAGAGEDRTSSKVEELLRYLIPATTFLGTVLVVVLAVVLLLIVAIMLVGRLIGVSHVTSAFIWCVVLVVVLFPWQTLLIGRAGSGATPGYGASAHAIDTGVARDPTFKIPGVLYTWEELSHDVRHFPQGASAMSVLKWARYAGLPIAAMLLLMVVQARSSRGLKFALGESEVQVELTSRGG